jgi:hypothetical protein
VSEIIQSQQIDPTSFYLTSLSSNTPESIAYDIRREFAEHPVTGLNKAELYIYSTSQAIRLAINNIATDKRRIDALNRDLRRLLKYQFYHLGGIYHLFTRKYLDLETLEIEDKIRAGQMAIAEAVPMLEDAQAELTAALSEREQIFAAVPWVNVSKAQLRELSDRERLVAKLRRVGAAQGRIDPGLSENTPLLPEPLPSQQPRTKSDGASS